MNKRISNEGIMDMVMERVLKDVSFKTEYKDGKLSVSYNLGPNRQYSLSGTFKVSGNSLKEIANLPDSEVFRILGIRSSRFKFAATVINFRESINEDIAADENCRDQGEKALEELDSLWPTSCYDEFLESFLKCKNLFNFMYPDGDYNTHKLEGSVFKIPAHQRYFMYHIWPVLKKDLV